MWVVRNDFKLEDPESLNSVTSIEEYESRVIKHMEKDEACFPAWSVLMRAIVIYLTELLDRNNDFEQLLTSFLKDRFQILDQLCCDYEKAYIVYDYRTFMLDILFMVHGIFPTTTNPKFIVKTQLNFNPNIFKWIKQEILGLNFLLQIGDKKNHNFWLYRMEFITKVFEITKLNEQDVDDHIFYILIKEMEKVLELILKDDQYNNSYWNYMKFIRGVLIQFKDKIPENKISAQSVSFEYIIDCYYDSIEYVEDRNELKGIINSIKEKELKLLLEQAELNNMAYIFYLRWLVEKSGYYNQDKQTMDQLLQKYTKLTDSKDACTEIM